MRAPLLGAAIFLLVASTSARVVSGADQGAATSTGTAAGSGLIVGTVVDGETNRPVPGAIVSISASAAAGSAAAAFRALPVAADGEGRFFFRDLPRGRFELSASAPGYLKANPFGARRAGGTSQAIELQDGERLKDITIAMWKPAEISGEITDEAGEPLPNAQVFAMPVLPGSGEARFGQTRGDVTDDRGVFRFI